MKKIRKLLSAVLSTAIIAASAVCGISISAETSAAAIKATPLTGWTMLKNNWQFVRYNEVSPIDYLTTANGVKLSWDTSSDYSSNISTSKANIQMQYKADKSAAEGEFYPLPDDFKTNGTLMLYVKTYSANKLYLVLQTKGNHSYLENNTLKLNGTYKLAAIGEDRWTEKTVSSVAGSDEYNGLIEFDAAFEGYIKIPAASINWNGTSNIGRIESKFAYVGGDYGDVTAGPFFYVTSDSESTRIEVPKEYRTAPVQATPVSRWTANKNAAKVISTVTLPLGEIDAQGIKMTAATAFEKGDAELGSNDNYTGFKLAEAEALTDTSGYIFYLKTDSANTVMPHFEINAGKTWTPAMGIVPGKNYEYRTLDADKWSTGTAVACTTRSGFDGGIKLDGPFEGFIKVSYSTLKNDSVTMNTAEHTLANFILKVKGLGDSYGNVTVGPVMLITSDSASPEIEVPAEYRPSPINVNSVEFKSAINGAYAFSANPVENGYSLSISDSVLSEDEVKFVGGENGTKKWSYVEADDANIGGNGLTNLKMTPKLPLAPRDVDGFIVYLKTESANAFAFQLTYEKGTHWTKNWFPEMHLIPGKTVMVKASSSSRWEEKTVDVGRTGNTSIYGAVKFDSAFDGYIKIPYSSIGRDDSWKPYTTVEDGAIDRITEVVFRFKGVGGKLENGLYGNVTAGLVGYFTEDSTSVEMNITEPAYLTGDVNNDCFRDSKDLIQLRKYLLGVEAEINPEYANVDESEDQQVNIIDLVRLKKLISNME